MNNKKVIRKINRNTNGAIACIVKNVSIAFGMACVIEFALLCLVALILTRVDVAHVMYSQIAIILPVVAVFLATLTVGRLSKNFGMVYGFVLGFAVFIILLFVSAVIMQSGLNQKTLYLSIMVITASGMGGFIGSSMKFKRRIR